MTRIILSILAVGTLLVSSSAWADVLVSPVVSADGCKTFTICDANAAAAACGGASTENFARPGGFTHHTFTATWVQGGGADDGWTIKAYNTLEGVGYDATQRALINSLGDITVSNPTVIVSGALGDVHAVRGTYTDDTVTLTLESCP